MQSHHEDITTEYSVMNSKVVQEKNGRVKFPIMEPTQGKRRSQIEEYLAFHRGPGAQHLALLTDDIVGTASALRSNGIQFLETPNTYYEVLEDRVGRLNQLQDLHELGILVDLDPWGQLMQVFTKPLHGRPTVFMEIMQRKGARGFGGANIRALFEAIERDQIRRGNS